MCGIAGFIGPKNRDLLTKLGEGVHHRGPDQEGIYEDEGLSVAHKRLAIIDLSTDGRQPMTTPDGRFVLAYNGEVYNYQELRTKYASLGWKFQTKTDSECFLAAAALGRLEQDLGSFHGMFAFCLWDTQTCRAFFARDRMGIKPLFFTQAADRFGFASELHALLSLKPKGAWRLNKRARSMFLGVGYVPGPETMFEGIEQFPCGQLLCYEQGRLRSITSFTQSTESTIASSKENKADQLRNLVDRVVADQLVSDRPVGVFLSGGMDSSAILSSVRAANPDGIIRTYTTRFAADAGDPKFNYDADLARKTAERFHCEHKEITVGPEDMIANIERIATSLGQPNYNHSVVALDAVARLAANEVAVALSGDGGDELFGGYERYAHQILLGKIARILPVRMLARAVGPSIFHKKPEFFDAREAVRLLAFGTESFSHLTELFSDAWDKVPLIERWATVLADIEEPNSIKRLMALDRATWLRDEAFARMDHVSMQHGLEVRVPLIDDTLCQFASTLTQDELVTRSESKRLMRQAFKDRCLPEVVHGKKRGWFPPTAKWLRTGLRSWSEEVLEEAYATQAWINAPLVRKLYAQHLTGERYGLHELWTIIAYQCWWRAYRTYFTE